jgi:hypothetical protein
MDNLNHYLEDGLEMKRFEKARKQVEMRSSHRSY